MSGPQPPVVGVFNATQMESLYPDGIEHHYWSIARASIVADLVVSMGWDKAPILEVGCGRGVQVQALRARGMDCEGVERAPIPPLEALRGVVHSGVALADLPAAQRGRVRVVLLLDVLEHIAEPVAFLAQVLEALPGVEGLVATAPAGPELWSNFDVFNGHQRRYRAREFAELIAAAGCTALRTGYAFRLLYPPVRALVASGRDRATAILAPPPGRRWLHRRLAELLTWDYRLLPRMLPGTSCWCVASRERGAVRPVTPRPAAPLPG